MKSKGLNIFKIILFFAGLTLIAAIFALVNNPIPEEGLKAGQKFFWIDIVICYLVFFVPLFFGSISIKNFDTKITSTTNIWISVIIFEIIAIVFAILTLKEIVSFKVSLIIELIAFFIAAIFVYFGYFAGNHIGNVQAAEEKSLGKIQQLKSAFELLNLKSDMWTKDFSTQKEKVKKLCDDVKYMSPVDSDLSLNLENQLISMANSLAVASFTPSEMDSKILELTSLVNQRKILKK